MTDHQYTAWHIQIHIFLHTLHTSFTSRKFDTTILISFWVSYRTHEQIELHIVAQWNASKVHVFVCCWLDQQQLHQPQKKSILLVSHTHIHTQHSAHLETANVYIHNNKAWKSCIFQTCSPHINLAAVSEGE